MKTPQWTAIGLVVVVATALSWNIAAAEGPQDPAAPTPRSVYTTRCAPNVAWQRSASALGQPWFAPAATPLLVNPTGACDELGPDHFKDPGGPIGVQLTEIGTSQEHVWPQRPTLCPDIDMRHTLFGNEW